MNKLKDTDGKFETLCQISEELKASGLGKCALIFGKLINVSFPHVQI